MLGKSFCFHIYIYMFCRENAIHSMCSCQHNSAWCVTTRLSCSSLIAWANSTRHGSIMINSRHSDIIIYAKHRVQ